MKRYEELFIATTDTVVGIGAPMTESNRRKIMKIKERPEEKKLVVMVSSIAEARTFAGWNENAEAIAQKYWPGQVTIVLEEVGLRIPHNKGLINLMNEVGPIYMTSANKSGHTTLKLKEAIETFPEIKRHYNFGFGTNVSSTIIRASNMAIIRQGDVRIKIG
ncbi:L-threonylcarbamoyladenylate synthase [Mycoplasma todarodis]|uniref:L-threonylcarbamoyladenylate synthase n=1 Tax=Mycoplasma todarodis TaxID=1937191 RepID=A0A4R0XSL5_9MOLU|nr:Sua5/YciO/YrdC/YwlC family protein [Mycoplasma todarodis]TCG10589.1 SUA5-like translation suppressor [Mycoplasma todarodis]